MMTVDAIMIFECSCLVICNVSKSRFLHFKVYCKIQWREKHWSRASSECCEGKGKTLFQQQLCPDDHREAKVSLGVTVLISPPERKELRNLAWQKWLSCHVISYTSAFSAYAWKHENQPQRFKHTQIIITDNIHLPHTKWEGLFSILY